MDDQGGVDTTYWPSWPESGEENREASDLNLQDARREIWVGLPVMIMRGRGRGILARVLGTGSGWVQIRVASEDGADPMLSDESVEMSKRAVDLNVIKGYENVPPPPPGITGQSSGTGDEDVTQESGEGDSQPEEIQVGDYVRVTEGNLEGKVGKVLNVERGGVLTLSIRNVPNIVLKRRAEVEFSSKGGGADSPSSQLEGGGRPSRLSARRGAEFLNKRVQIISTGQVGVVVRLGAAGMYIVALEQPDSGEEVAKRKDELRILAEGDDDGLSQPDETAAPSTDDAEVKDGPLSRVRASTRASSNSPKTGTRGAGRRAGGGGGKGSTAASSQDGEEVVAASGPAARTAAATSAGAGGTKRVARSGAGTRARNGAAAKRQQREITPEQYSQTRLEAARRARQDLIVGFLSRSREKLERTMGMASRPNLQEWLELIQGCEEEDQEEDEEDEYTPLVYDPAFCPTCLLEKESPEEFCWNAACWECPVYDPSAVPLMESALPVKGGLNRFSALAQSPRKPGFIDYANIPKLGNVPPLHLVNFADQQQRSKQQREEEEALARMQEGGARQALPKVRRNEAEEELEEGLEEPHKHTTVNILPSRFKAGKKRLEQEMIASPLVTYAIRAPGRWLGETQLKAQHGLNLGPVGYFGAGWKEGLVYDEPMLPRGDQQDKLDTALDFRWRRNLVN